MTTTTNQERDEAMRETEKLTEAERNELLNAHPLAMNMSDEDQRKALEDIRQTGTSSATFDSRGNVRRTSPPTNQEHGEG
jgi:hypothetical protein